MQNYKHQDVLTANQKYYDKVGKNYRVNEYYAYSTAIINDVLNNIKHCSSLLREKKKFLDFGCGSGFLSELIYKNNLFEYAIGIDISKAQIELFNQKFKCSNFKGFIGDITILPFRNAVFDMAGCYSVLHHIYDYQSVIEEITRVLKPNGILYVDFEPTKEFRKLMAIPLRIRRKLFDKAPSGDEQLEYLAEYHHNVENGIHKDKLINWLKKDYKILAIKPRFPDTISKHVLQILFKCSWSFAPYFYIIAQKKF